MVRAVSELDFIPGDIQVIGAKLEKPEQGIKASLNANQLLVVQEQPTERDEFFDACLGLSELAIELLRPSRVLSNGFAQKLYWGFASPEAALNATLSLPGNEQVNLSKEFEMPLSHKRLEYHFKSGSYDFSVIIQPVTFERVAKTHFNPRFYASPEQRRRIDRLNKHADRVKAGPAHALLMDLDLIEQEPPASSLRRHYDQLMEMKRPADRMFQVK